MNDRDTAVPTVPTRDHPVRSAATPRDRQPAPRQAERERYDSIDRYVVLRQVGSGGMGTVYEAYDPLLRRRVAIKLIRAAQAGDGDAQVRLLREARAMARLSHPHVIPVYDVGLDDGHVFITMEFIAGQTLRRFLARPRPWADVLRAFRAAGRGLEAAHEAGLVHRDFKPDNVMVEDAGRVLVLDFGVVASWQAPDASREVRQLYDVPADHSSTGLTRDGRALGTPAYMAPEQHEGRVVDGRADQYAFCVALFEGLYGTRPFGGRSVVELADDKRTETFVPLPAHRVPAGVDAVIRRGLAYEPDARWPSVSALLTAIDDVIRARRRRRSTVIGGLMSAGLVAGLAWPRPHPCAAIAPAVPSAQLTAELLPHHTQWHVRRVALCEADQDTALSQRQAWCLDERRAELITAASLSPAAVAWLQPAAVCDDASRLQAWTQPPPEHPERVLELRRALLRAHVQPTTVAELESLVEAATATGDLRLRAQAQLTRLEEDPKAGPGMAFQAAATAMKAGDAQLEARAWVGGLQRMAADGKRSDEVVGWRPVVEALIERGGGDPTLTTRWALVLADCLRALEQADEARAVLDRARHDPGYAFLAASLRRRLDAALLAASDER